MARRFRKRTLHGLTILARDWKREGDDAHRMVVKHRKRTDISRARRAQLLLGWRRKRNKARRRERAVRREIARRNKAAMRRQMRALNTLGARAWREAGKLLAVREVGGNNSGAKVMEFIRTTGGTGPEPWCGDFVAYCYKKAGSRTIARAWAAVRYFGHITGQSIIRHSDARKGDVVKFNFDHVGLFGYWCNYDGVAVPRGRATHIRTREGNTQKRGTVSDSTTGGDGVYENVRAIVLINEFVRVHR